MPKNEEKVYRRKKESEAEAKPVQRGRRQKSSSDSLPDELKPVKAASRRKTSEKEPNRSQASGSRMKSDAAGKTRKEKTKSDGQIGKIYTGAKLRDPRKKQGEVTAGELRHLINRKPDLAVILIALVTAVFETLGLLLAAAHTQETVGMDSLSMIAVIVPLGLFTTLVLPRLMPMDGLVMALTNFLCGVGIVTLCTVSPLRGNRQITYYAIGLGLMVIMCLMVTRMRRFHGITFLMMLISLGALAMPLLFGEWNNGAKNWVSLPFFGSFQPSELVKIAVIFSLAYYFSAHRTLMQMMPALIFSIICLLFLMLQRDLGTALIYYLATLVVFYIACGNIPLTLVGAGGGVAAAVMGYQMFAHVKVRVAMWRNPWSDPTGSGYQIIQALLAIGSGGLFGVGLGQGTPEKIPAYYNDFIFAVICEQFGQVFGVLLIGVYVLLLIRGITMANRSRRSFTMLMGYGTVAMLGIQTFMITAGVIKLIPLTGVTMPFLSYGGSSMISCLTMIGIMHGIAGKAQLEMENEILMERSSRKLMEGD